MVVFPPIILCMLVCVCIPNVNTEFYEHGRRKVKNLNHGRGDHFRLRRKNSRTRERNRRCSLIHEDHGIRASLLFPPPPNPHPVMVDDNSVSAPVCELWICALNGRCNNTNTAGVQSGRCHHHTCRWQ